MEVYNKIIYSKCNSYHWRWSYSSVNGLKAHLPALNCFPEYKGFPLTKEGFWSNLANLKVTLLQNMPKQEYCWCQ